jgi:copper(I)-binding protein
MPMKFNFAIAGMLTLLTTFVHGQDNGITVIHPWSRATAATGQVGVAFLVMSNANDIDDALTSVRSEDADSTEIHATSMDDKGVMHMDQVKQVSIPAHGKVEFKPEGYHIMLMGLKRPLRKGERVPITLEFYRAGSLRVEAVVLAPDAMGPNEAIDEQSKGK